MGFFEKKKLCLLVLSRLLSSCHSLFVFFLRNVFSSIYRRFLMRLYGRKWKKKDSEYKNVANIKSFNN